MPPPRTRVLVVDDNPDMVDSLVALLETDGYDVKGIYSALNIVSDVRAFDPDVVIMDLAMPALDGTSALRLLRKDPRTAQLPVVACTGQVDGRELEAARRAGFDAMIRKPVVLEELVNMLRGLARPS